MITLTEIKQLLKRNLNVELLCIKDSRLNREAERLGIAVHTINIIGKVHPFASFRTASVLKKGAYDVIHTHASKDLWVLVPALNLIKSATPLTLTKHVGSYIIKKDFLHRKLYSRVNKMIAISNAIKKNIIDTLPVKPEDVILVHNGIDTSRFHSTPEGRERIRDEFCIKENDVLIGMIARFSPGKGHEEFIASAAELSKNLSPGNHGKQQTDYNLRFIIVGEASRGEEEYANSVKKLALQNELDIIFTGFRNDTPDILAAMDIFIFPSHSESFGIALAEALSAGTPSVCSDTEGVPDIAINNVTSLYFKAKDYHDLSLKTQMLIDSPELRKKFSEASRKRAVELFDISIHTDNLLKVYRLLTNK